MRLSAYLGDTYCDLYVVYVDQIYIRIFVNVRTYVCVLHIAYVGITTY